MTNTITDVVVSRGATVPFAEMPAKSIALDGYCQGPAVDIEGERFSFDHHAGCIRLFTRATCQQVLDALLLGFNPAGYTVYVNDVDGDTVLATWLLLNPIRAAEPLVRELVEVVGAIDAHGPAYPSSNPKLANLFFQGVMAPEVELRRKKQYATADLQSLLAACVAPIGRLLVGAIGIAPPLERSYEITHRSVNGWVMAKSNNFVFDLLYADGYNCAIAYQELPDGSVNYTVGKKSELVGRFPVGPGDKAGTILATLNARESGWGGGSTIGGSPRNADGSRSRLTPNEVFAIVEAVVGEGK